MRQSAVLLVIALFPFVALSSPSSVQAGELVKTGFRSETSREVAWCAHFVKK